jgi:hypothetical protein
MVSEPVNDLTKVLAEVPAKGLSSLTVLYDGACPLCRREIGVYSGLQPLRPDSPVCFADVSDTAYPLPSALPPGTTREQLLARFHVRSSDGQLLSGAQAGSWGPGSWGPVLTFASNGGRPLSCAKSKTCPRSHRPPLLTRTFVVRHFRQATRAAPVLRRKGGRARHSTRSPLSSGPDAYAVSAGALAGSQPHADGPPP